MIKAITSFFINPWTTLPAKKNACANSDHAIAMHELGPKTSTNDKSSGDPPKPSQPIKIPLSRGIKRGGNLANLNPVTNSLTEEQYEIHETPSLTPPGVWYGRAD